MRIHASLAPIGVAVALLLPAVALGQPAVDIWLDPGHGGNDKGTLGFDGIRVEKTIAIQVNAHLYTQLINLGYSVYITRLSDYSIPLEDRARMASGELANVNGDLGICQLFISMHMDAREDRSKFGTTTYYQSTMDRNRRKDASLVGKGMADIIHPRLIANTAAAFLGCSSNLNVLPANYSVLRNSAVPSILIESCILTNQCQQNRIAQNGNQALIAQGIAAGVSFAIVPGGSPNGTSKPAPRTSVGTVRPETIGGRGVWLHASEHALSFLEDFEDPTFPPAGWTLTTLGAAVPHRWHRTTDMLYVHLGTAAALVGGESSSAMDEWLISPVALLGPSDASLRFYWSSNTRFAAEVNAECLAKRTTESTWTRLWQLSDEPAVAEWDWKERTVSVAGFAGDSVQFAFRVSGTSGADFNLDDFSVGDFPVTAAPPNDACENAAPLPAGTFSLSGTTFYSANDADPAAPDSLACSVDPLSSGDVFYTFNAFEGDTLAAKLNAAWNAVSYIVDACDSSTANCLVVAGQFDPISPDGASFTHVFVSTGTYLLVVDGRAGEGGPFSLSGFLRGATTDVADGLPPGGLTLRIGPNPAVGPVEFTGSILEGAAGPVRLRVHDAAGRLVAAFEPGVRGGRFSVRWDRTDRAGGTVRAGVYFATLTAGSVHVSRTLIVRD